MKTISRRLLLLTSVCCLTAGSVLAGTPTYTFDCRDMPVRDALELIGKLEGRPYRMAPALVGAPTIQGKNRSLKQLMDTLTKALPVRSTWKIDEKGALFVECSGGIQNLDPMPRYPTDPNYARTSAVVSRDGVRRAVLVFNVPSESSRSTSILVGEGESVTDPTTKRKWRVQSIRAQGCVLQSGKERRTLRLQGYPR
jgi:hypothetical protein